MTSADLSLSTTFYPPSSDILEHFTYDVSAGHAETIVAFDTVNSLGGFVEVVARAQVKALHRKPSGLVDHDVP